MPAILLDTSTSTSTAAATATAVSVRRPRPLPPGPLPAALYRPDRLPDVWQLTVSEHRAVIGDARRVLDAAERRRHEELRIAAERDRYAAAHLGLRRLLGAYLALDPAEVVLDREPCPLCAGPHGRPAVPGADLHFSLSHSGDLVLFAVGPTPVGVDVELLPEPEVADELADSLHPGETAELARLADQADRLAAFGRCWCRKEAYLKGIGTGLGVDPSLAYVGTGDRPTGLPGWTLADLAVPPGYAAALAYAAPRSALPPDGQDPSAAGPSGVPAVPSIRNLSTGYQPLLP
ncbi:4'-phosphopantetheinyl transferase superfamily protein [Kitasatospora sp. NPDC089797]|uniref:4'-phosphopantetheinyl transferase family protein n=1 Tax=Kitasatospora sp. NPDC089797 TaxID=3155298 RepID=UPI003439E269